MKSQKQIEQQLADTKRQLEEIKKLNTIATFPGKESVLELFNERKEFHDKAIHSFNPKDPDLVIGFAVHKACLGLMEFFISGITDAENKYETLKKQFLDLNEELGKIMDKKAEYEKNRM